MSVTATSPVTARVMAGLALIVAVVVPAPAYAHGISGDAAETSTLGFVGIGVQHMLLGWDHLAFVAGVLLLAQSFRLAVKLISLFVLGHSTTLIAATIAGWRVDADAVDAVIALSVAFVGCVGIIGRPTRWGWFATAVTVFGLIHGLGLATRFDALDLPEDGKLAKVIFFNIGIEIGQATAIFAMLVLGTLAASYLRPLPNPAPDEGDLTDAGPMWTDTQAALLTHEETPSRPGPVDAAVDEVDDEEAEPRTREVLARQLLCAGLFLVGAVAAGQLALDAVTAEAPAERAMLADGTSCLIEERTDVIPGAGGHPPASFYGPDDIVPVDDFGHALGDGYVVVWYDPDLDTTSLEALEALVASPEGRGLLVGAATPSVVAGLDTDPLAGGAVVRAVQIREAMTCEQLELESLSVFSTNWLSRI